jgi:nucleoside-diphosphate-sugar epimerase
MNIPLHIFRLAGIYGPGRSAIDSVRAGTARCIDKPGHVFNRIHVEDIVQTLVASMNAPKPGAIYNLADDTPTPSHEVISHACALTGAEAPPLVPFERADMAPIVRSFYKDNKRVKNDKIKRELGVTLLYPDYRTGLQACLAQDCGGLDILRFDQKAESPAVS